MAPSPEPKAFTVSQFVTNVSAYLEQGLGMIAVQGEVIDFKIAKDRLVFFELKDESSRVSCFMMKWDLHQPLEDGMEVRVLGTPKLFQQSGRFHIRVMNVELVGQGALERAFRLLKEKLEKEGLFAPERKRALPQFPETIGLVTSEEAAAYTDVLRVFKNRWPSLHIILAHVPVQGVGAIPEIVGAIRFLNHHTPKPNVIIVTRGGGSLEDLQAFNSEDIVRAIFASSIPVVVGVGHERDVTLADLVADVRAATPSNAAELVVPDQRDILYHVDAMIGMIDDAITGTIRDRRGSLVHRLSLGVDQWVQTFHKQLRHTTELLRVLSPRAILDRGYSITTKNGKTLKDIQSVHTGDRLQTILAKGSVSSIVETSS